MKPVFFVLCVIFLFSHEVKAQNCPAPYPDGVFQASVDIPDDNLPSGHYQVALSAYPEGLTLLIYNGGGNGSRSVMAPSGQDSLGQIYGLNTYLDFTSSLFKKEVFLIVNRRKTPSGADSVRISRFGAVDPNNNFLLTMTLTYDGQGHFNYPISTSCGSSTTVKEFNRQFLIVGIARPDIGIFYIGHLEALDFHNSLYQRVRCFPLFCPNSVDSGVVHNSNVDEIE